MDLRQGTKPLTVSEYAARIQRAAKTAGGGVVEGEVQKPRTTPGGAFMFDLADGDARLSCKVLPWILKRGLEHEPKDGDLVRVVADYPDFWPQGGSLSVVVDNIRLAGDGELLKRRHELIAKLAAEGLADPAAFPPLPRFPRAVGVIAGVESDALKDVIRGLGDRFPVAKVVTAACQVQGAGAPKAVIGSLAVLHSHPDVDVIIIARGGGSVQDLAAFDDEGLCRAIRAIDKPVITAIGHTDNSPVCNHITHAAYVPRHAAEMAVPHRDELLDRIEGWSATLDRAMRRPVEIGQTLEIQSLRLASGHAVLRRHAERAAELGVRLRAADFRERGWVIATHPDGTAATAAAGLTAGEHIDLLFADGRATATVESVDVEAQAETEESE